MKRGKPSKLRSPRFAVDINTSYSDLRRQCKGRAQFISTAELADQQALDRTIIKVCDKKDYHVVTQNTRDFIRDQYTFEDLRIGIVCKNTVDPIAFGRQFLACLRRFPEHEHFRGKLIEISSRGCNVEYLKDLKAEREQAEKLREKEKH